MGFRVEIKPGFEGDFLSGHIYYRRPGTHEIKAAQHRLSDYCRSRAKALFGEAEAVEKRLTSELRFLEETDSSFHFMVLKEIADFSKEEQSLMLTVGNGPLLIEYLLGASPIDPLPPHYRCDVCHSVEFSDAAADGYDLPGKNCPYCGKALIRDGHHCADELQQHDDLGRRARPYVAVKLSAGVIGKLQRRLDSRVCYAEERTYGFYDMELHSLPQDGMLKRLSELTGIRSSEIEPDDSRVWAYVAKDEYAEFMRGLALPDDASEKAKEFMRLPEDDEGGPDISFHDLIRIRGFGNATFLNRFEIPDLRSPTCYLTMDDVFDALLANGFSPDRAAVMTHRIARGYPRALDQVPGEIKGNMHALENLWTRSSCLNQLFYHRYFLKWYELRYPREYQQAYAENGDARHLYT